MSKSTAIGKVSESLLSLLEGEIKLDTIGVTVLAPDEQSTGSRLNLFLYKVMENPDLKNMDWQADRADPAKRVPPPLSLNLYYLMTAYAPNDAKTGNSEAHKILGEAMRVFYENPVVPDKYLKDDLKDAREEIKIMLNTLDLEELSKVWATFTQPFRLSVIYEVSVVQLDILSESETRIAERVKQIGVPDMKATFNLPVVENMKPENGRIGTTVTFTGKNLSGWKATVSMTGIPFLQDHGLNEDSLEFIIPEELVPNQPIKPGLYNICVDISGLFRKTFLFEVVQ